VTIEKKYVVARICGIFLLSLPINVIFCCITNEKCEHIKNCLENSKKLHSHIILVYKHHINNSSDFDKLLLRIYRKGIHGTHSRI
jgi:hypothetical protein